MQQSSKTTKRHSCSINKLARNSRNICSNSKPLKTAGRARKEQELLESVWDRLRQNEGRELKRGSRGKERRRERKEGQGDQMSLKIEIAILYMSIN
jgi:hypothetical protein